MIKRFPLLIILIVAFTALLLTELHWDFSRETSNNLMKIGFSIAVTFFLSLWFYISSENVALSRIKKIWLQILALIFWISFFLWLKQDLESFVSVISIILTLIWITSYVFFAPYVSKIFLKENIQEIYYAYFFKLSVVYLISTILWGVLFALWSIWISAVFALFDLYWVLTEKIYWDWAIIALSFVTPIFALTQIPKKETFNEKWIAENAFFSFLIKYIAIPFIYVYFIILYAYSIKVLFNFTDWPKWEVTWLVIWFSIFGYLIYMFTYIFEEKYNFIKFFRKWFPYVVIPQLLMLFYAIYLRISQYDLTMNRYFIVIFGIWLLVISLYLILSRKKYLAYIPLILTAFTVIISIWPWWVYSLPETRQLSRLEDNLMKAWILQNWNIVPLKNIADISEDLSRDIYSGISYLCEYGDCKAIKELFPEQYSKVLKDGKYDVEINGDKRNWPYSWEIIRGITEDIKVRQYYNSKEESSSERINLNIDYADGIFPINTVWYSQIMMIWEGREEKEGGEGRNEVSVSWAILTIRREWNIIDSVSIKDVMDKLSSDFEKNKLTTLKKEEMSFDLKWNSGTYKLILSNIRIKNPSFQWNATDEYYGIQWYLLVK